MIFTNFIRPCNALSAQLTVLALDCIPSWWLMVILHKIMVILELPFVLRSEKSVNSNYSKLIESFCVTSDIDSLS